MKLLSRTIAAALIAGASALPMQSANAFWMTPDGYGSFGPWNWSEYGMSNRGGPWGGGYGGGYGAPYGGGYGAPYGGGYGAPYAHGFPFYGYGAPYYPAAPAQAPAQKD
uniref:Sulfur globule protein CV1 n=1 Tax=Candidatus Kentrum eta TaxID=2126337 RepID=A0A450U790_9GAMM|nr:MAG: hypothetical protein BECKH772A_GA0070896_1000412 [Candidatus Kentron sp. H]VFJ89315.1 MAG: hypothetical protein BECKH772B_GA0070898_1000412 [Candidatus Kentron sp. H]VFJ95899.1 MAG: hypothetical protein BECKH772C_GA0070978_1000412 [Candidatus Kentron sp. H]